MDKLKQHIQDNREKLEIDQTGVEMWNRIKRELVSAGDTDPLKSHIAQHDKDLEIEIPGNQTWNTIQNRLNAKRVVRILQIKKALAYCAAACMIAIVGLGAWNFVNHFTTKDNEGGIVNIQSKVSAPPLVYIIPDTARAASAEIHFQHNRRVKQVVVQSAVNRSSRKIGQETPSPLSSPELKIEKGYDELIANQVKYTQSLALYGEDPTYFQGFVNDFKALDLQEKQLRKSIISDGMQDEQIAELATIYQQKLWVLKKLQVEINKISNRNKGITNSLPAHIQL